MTSIPDLEADPSWLPHSIDAKSQIVEFIRVPSEVFLRPGFLFEYEPTSKAERVRLSFDQVLALEVASAPIHYIFHSGFCRSTLMARALNLEKMSLGLSEPGIIASIANAMPLSDNLVRKLLTLLARPRNGESAVFIKPTNHANRLIPLLLRATPNARAILMSCSLKPFLLSIEKRGLLGKRWGRQLYLEMQSYARLELGLSAEETFSLTDMQTAGLAWLAAQRYFDALRKSEFGSRLRLLDSDHFINHREQTLSAILNFSGVAIDEKFVSLSSVAGIFEVHSKFGGIFQAKNQDDGEQLVAQEIFQTEEWINLIAKQFNLNVPLRTDLA